MTWQSQIIALLTASAVRPLALAATAWLILLIFRVRHPASRHAVWSAVLVGMIVLPILSVVTPHWKLALLPVSRSVTAQSITPASSGAPESCPIQDDPETGFDSNAR